MIWVNFFIFDLKNTIVTHTKDFVGKKKSKYLIFYNVLQHVAKYNMILFKKKSYLVYNEIWLNILEDDHQFGHITKYILKTINNHQIFFITYVNVETNQEYLMSVHSYLCEFKWKTKKTLLDHISYIVLHVFCLKSNFFCHSCDVKKKGEMEACKGTCTKLPRYLIFHVNIKKTRKIFVWIFGYHCQRQYIFVTILCCNSILRSS